VSCNPLKGFQPTPSIISLSGAPLDQVGKSFFATRSVVTMTAGLYPAAIASKH